MIKRSLIAILALITLAGCNKYTVYSVKDESTFRLEGGVVYALPSTQLCVAVTIEQRDMSQAIYKDFATECLGVNTADLDTMHRISSIDVSTLNVADLDNWFFVKIRRGSVTVNDQHLLTAIGMTGKDERPTVQDPAPTPATAATSQPIVENNMYERLDTLYNRYDKPGHPTLVSSRKDTRTLKQRAQRAAEQLEELRDREQQLLSGESESIRDLNTMRYLSNQLRRQQDDIVASFCGRIKQETVKYYITPKKHKQDDNVDTLAYFSPRHGLLPANWEKYPSDAKPSVCTVRTDNTLQMPSRFIRNNVKGTLSTNKGVIAHYKSRTFRYRIPENAIVNIDAGSYSCQRQVLVSQFGPVMLLSTRNSKAQFDPKTLDLIYLGQ